MLQTRINSVVYNGPPSTHPGIVQFNVGRHRKSLLEDEGCRVVSCVGSREPEVGEPWEAVGLVKYKFVDAQENQAEGKQREEGRQEEGEKVQEIGHDWPEGINRPLMREFWPRLTEVRERYKRELGSYVFVDTLAVEPEWQGQGAGRLLMEEVCKEADERGWESMLEATEEGVRLYEKMGFVEREKLWVDLGRWEGGGDRGVCWRREGGLDQGEGVGEGWCAMVIMVRPAKKS